MLAHSMTQVTLHVTNDHGISAAAGRIAREERGSLDPLPPEAGRLRACRSCGGGGPGVWFSGRVGGPGVWFLPDLGGLGVWFFGSQTALGKRQVTGDTSILALPGSHSSCAKDL